MKLLLNISDLKIVDCSSLTPCVAVYKCIVCEIQWKNLCVRILYFKTLFLTTLIYTDSKQNSVGTLYFS